MSSRDLYEATRGVWKLGRRREGAQVALAVQSGVILEVYEIHAWHPAGSTPYASRQYEDVNLPGRWEFTGAVAPTDVRDRYIGESVAQYLRPGARAPVLYVNL